MMKLYLCPCVHCNQHCIYRYKHAYHLSRKRTKTRCKHTYMHIHSVSQMMYSFKGITFLDVKLHTQSHSRVYEITFLAILIVQLSLHTWWVCNFLIVDYLYSALRNCLWKNELFLYAARQSAIEKEFSIFVQNWLVFLFFVSFVCQMFLCLNDVKLPFMALLYVLMHNCFCVHQLLHCFSLCPVFQMCACLNGVR